KRLTPPATCRTASPTRGRSASRRKEPTGRPTPRRRATPLSRRAKGTGEDTERSTMFRWFEERLNPFPEEPPAEPPRTLLAFAWHYTKGAWPWLVAVMVLTAIFAVLQVTVFGFLGNIVDWLAGADRQTFLRDEYWRLIAMATVILVLLPALSLGHSLIMYQTLFGNYPMRIRWQAHR